MWVTNWQILGRCSTPAAEEYFGGGRATRAVQGRCLGCPVRLECLADALDNRITHGMWGGLSSNARGQMVRRHPGIKSWTSLLRSLKEALAAGPVDLDRYPSPDLLFPRLSDQPRRVKAER
jgi:WhiB family redox-sensing transcriptional regulator